MPSRTIRNDPEYIAKKAKIDVYHASLLGYFLDKLRSTHDGDGSLLDSEHIMYGGGLGNGNLHEHTKLPVLMAGNLGGKSRPGQYCTIRRTPNGQPAADRARQGGRPRSNTRNSTGLIEPDIVDIVAVWASITVFFALLVYWLYYPSVVTPGLYDPAV